jgi:nitroreductase
MESPWPQLVRDARLSPSPHNTQPWLISVVSADEAALYVPTERTLPHTDASGAFMTAGLGIFVEALDVAAAPLGLEVQAECLFPKLGADSEELPLFARLHLVERTAVPRFRLELLEQRRTARGAYDGRPADADALAALEALAKEAGHRANFTSRPELVDWIVALNAETVFYDLADDEIREEIGRWVRTTEREARQARDGFSPRCLGFPGVLVNLFFFHHGLFSSRPVRAILRRVFLHSTRGTKTVGWIQGPWSTPEEWYEAGRMFMRFWLELTRHGLYLQPYGSVITNPTAHALMTDKLDVDASQGEVWLLLRLGYCPPPPRSLRRAPEEVVR